jgi:rubrerythrin
LVGELMSEPTGEPVDEQARGFLFADLRAAFASEATAVQRYTYFAQVAEIEGHMEVARLFTEMAESVACVAHGHIDFLQQVGDPSTEMPMGDTPLNLAAAVAGAAEAATKHYPRLVALAHTEGIADAASWLTTLCALKNAHVQRLGAALSELTGRAAAPAEAG